MGRRVFLTRLALGRSAFEPLAPEVPPETATDSHKDDGPKSRSVSGDEHEVEQETIVASPKQGSILGRSCDYEQQYDKKGYPENSSTKALKKRWRRAINHVLATLGLCVAKGQDSSPTLLAHDTLRFLQVNLENSFGVFISAIDKLLRLGSESWSTALRQRLQTFKFYSGTALFKIIKSEWTHHGWAQFLFSGMLSTGTFLILDAELEALTNNIFKALQNITEGICKPGSRREKLKNFVIVQAGAFTRLVLFILIAPIEIHGILQRLDLIPAWPPFPHPRAYAHTFSAIFGPRRGLENFNSIIFPLLVYVFCRRNNNSIKLQIHDHFWAALPKPTCPDQFSRIAARVDGLDSSDIAGLPDKNIAEDERANATVVNRSSSDNHCMARNWQIFYDRCERVWSWVYVPPTTSDLAESIRPDRALANNPGSGLAPDRSLSYAPEPAPATINPRLYEQEPLHDPPNHFSPPRESLASPQSRPSTPSPPYQSNTSSALPSRSASPRPIELTAHNDNGEVHVNLTIPAPPGMMRRPSIADTAHRARAVTDLPEGLALPESATWITDPAAIERISGPRAPIAGRSRRKGPQHRLTALTAFPAESIAQRLSSLAMSTLYLPFEAHLMRTVAIAFLSSPSQSSASGVAAAARWKSEVYPPGAWFGPGLSGKAWKGVVGYVQKILLVQVLGAGVGYVTWQLGMGLVWWVGRGWCSWTKAESDKLVRERSSVGVG